MVLLKKGTIAAALLMGSLCFGQAAFAQQATTPATQKAQTSQKFSDADLQQFINANLKATEIQKKGREDMVAAIKEQNLTPERFNELAQAHQQKKLDEVAKDPEEIAAFSNAAQAVIKVQPVTKTKVDEAIKAEGLTVEKYEAMLNAFENDPAVKAKVAALMSKQ
ncbi:DUF4168 domain-containing protein [Pontibacter chitinilyticus]|uniref:DUF4168 domain-containing protein n=1 Tax=Pontibacter chitinilyticus TaxID=2674989 RepID=UPI00321A2C3C